MKFFRIFMIVFLLATIQCFSQANILKILFWNVDNLFDTTDDPGKDDKVLSKKIYQEKLNLISRQLINFDAHIVGLCEVENTIILKTLAEKSKYPYYYLLEGNDPRGIDVCLLSKYQLNYISHKDLPTPYKENKKYKFSRDCIEAHLDFYGEKIFLLLTHLKSSFAEPVKSEKKRIAQVKGILDIIGNIYKKSKPHSPYILLFGDMNSVRFSEPLNILEKSGLINLNYFTNQNKFYTFIYKKEKIDLDYMIMNKNLYDNVKIIKYQTHYNKNLDFSDHAIIYLEMYIQKFSSSNYTNLPYLKHNFTD